MGDKKCGEHEFNVSFKSTQGHELLPAERGADEGVHSVVDGLYLVV